jgi:hypothetical protein
MGDRHPNFIAKRFLKNNFKIEQYGSDVVPFMEQSVQVD